MINNSKQNLWDLDAKIGHQEEYVGDLEHQVVIEKMRLKKMQVEKDALTESTEGKHLLQE